jgi:transposase-like protein
LRVPRDRTGQFSTELFERYQRSERALVELVVSDDHAGLKAAIREVLPEAVWQRCYVHFLRNALDYVPRKVDDDCLQERLAGDTAREATGDEVKGDPGAGASAQGAGGRADDRKPPA